MQIRIGYTNVIEVKWCNFAGSWFKVQGYQYRTGGRTGLATGMIYFGYRSIPVYRFGFTAILYIYIYICMCQCIYIIINIKVYNKTFSQFRTNYSWFYTLVSIKWEKK